MSLHFFSLPYKSTALALLLGITLGPVGLLYGSVYFSLPMIALGILVIGSHLILPIMLFWIISAALNVFFIERYNKKLLERYLKSVGG